MDIAQCRGRVLGDSMEVNNLVNPLCDTHYNQWNPRQWDNKFIFDDCVMIKLNLDLITL